MNTVIANLETRIDSSARTAARATPRHAAESSAAATDGNNAFSRHLTTPAPKAHGDSPAAPASPDPAPAERRAARPPAVRKATGVDAPAAGGNALPPPPAVALPVPAGTVGLPAPAATRAAADGEREGQDEPLDPARASRVAAATAAVSAPPPNAASGVPDTEDVNIGLPGRGPVPVLGGTPGKPAAEPPAPAAALPAAAIAVPEAATPVAEAAARIASGAGAGGPTPSARAREAAGPADTDPARAGETDAAPAVLQASVRDFASALAAQGAAAAALAGPANPAAQDGAAGPTKEWKDAKESVAVTGPDPSGAAAGAVPLLVRAEPLARRDSAAAPPVSVPLDSPDWTQKLGDSVSWAVNQKLTHAQISLNPEHLGPLEIRLSLTGNQATVWFGTHSTAAADALHASSAHLKSLLGQSGFVQVNVDVSHQSGQQSPYSGSSYRAGGGAALGGIDSVADAEPAVTVVRYATRSQLDAYA